MHIISLPSQNRKRVPLGADLLRPDLRRIDPARHDIEHGKEPEVDEDERGRGRSKPLGSRFRRGQLAGPDERRDEEE